ncbi:MAG: formylglycine-generating enzyme family protein, partial [Sorangiineae bacterium PRO1]|nr:formylglycine-generating enzyme family protein [Sorangiineae bacterium PRO1]
GISWYEAMAFCTWLSKKAGENILLPTEPQWQRAAQGDDGRLYPWGSQKNGFS